MMRALYVDVVRDGIIRPANHITYPKLRLFGFGFWVVCFCAISYAALATPH